MLAGARGACGVRVPMLAALPMDFPMLAALRMDFPMLAALRMDSRAPLRLETNSTHVTFSCASHVPVHGGSLGMSREERG
ncbi:MAG: hypothetical protein OHK0013_24080 [Sandaracinaceae bacterium]